jgi:NADH:ubiquinone oxidoreductase subunit 6 (subunit J)
LVVLVQQVPLLPTVPTAQTLNTLANEGTLRSIGQLLFTKYMLPFELASILLLGAMVGALILARRQGDDASNNVAEVG